MTFDVIFWASLMMISYTYLLYPAILMVLASFRSRDVSSLKPSIPQVSVVIAVYNEESVLLDKLRNIRDTHYPDKDIEFLIGSDGSSDNTNIILAQSENPNLKCEFFPMRRGKASVLNDLIPRSSGEIVVLSDANTFYRPETVERLVSHFGDPMVGAVCGELVLEADDNTAGGYGEAQYWKYENLLKRLESDISTTMGGVGPLYAIRKALFVPLPTSKTIMDDFLIPLNIIKKGYKVKYDETAVAYEKPANSVSGEFRRKVRIGAANFHGLSEFWSLLHPRHGFISFALWSHKVLRWCIPFFLVAIAVSSVILAEKSPEFEYFIIAEALFVFAALLGFLLERLKISASIFGLAYYFLATNAALLVGFFKFLFGRQRPTWDVIR